MAESYMTATQVSEALGVSVPTIWRWARAGIIPAPVKLGPQTSRWSSEEIANHVNRAKVARENA